VSLKPAILATLQPEVAANDPVFDRPAETTMTCSLITSTRPRILSKTMRMCGGKLAKQAAAEMIEGRSELQRVDDAHAFAALLASLQPNQALVYGRCKRGDCDLYARKRYARLSPERQSTTSTRTKDAFEFANGPGILMLDYDPRPGAAALSPDDLRDAVTCALPELETCASVQWVSSSSCIFDSEGNELAGVRGQRIYIMVVDARDIPRAGAVLASRLWLAGYGYVEVSKSGARLARCLVDTSVWETNRLDFAAGAVCHDGLVQRRGDPVAHAGAPLDTSLALPDLSAADAAKLRGMQGEAMSAAEPLAKTARDAWIEQRAESEVATLPDAADMDVEERHIALAAARARARRAVEGQTLDGKFVVTVVDGDGKAEAVPVAVILANRDRYNECRTLDPLEPDYGDGRAVGVLLLKGGRPMLFSHAHGGASYALVHTLHRIEHARGGTQGTTDLTLAFLRDGDMLFDRGTEMVYADAHGLHRAKGAALAYALGRCVQYVQRVPKGRGKDRVMVDQPIDPPLGVLQQIEGLMDARRLKRIRAAISAPVMVPGGRIVQEPGHDALSELYVLADCSAVHVPERVNEAAAMQALGVLWHPFREFDCADKLDRGVLLAAILTAIERPALPTAPGFGLDAPTQGTGKTYLAQCLAALAQGSLPAVDPPVGDDEPEIRKRLLAAALAGPPVIVWDNLTGTLRSPALAAFLTTERFSDRVLGESRDATGETRSLFLLTGNNLSLAGDMPRRVLKCRLDARTENPATRVFRDNPRGDILRRRHELVQAGLTLLRGYRQSGWKATKTTASFEVWDSLVRQCVAWVVSLQPDQFEDPGEGFAANAEGDPEREELAELLDGLVAVLDVGALAANEGWFTAADVAAAIESPNTHETASLRRTLQALCVHGLSPKAVGRVLTFRKDRRIGNRCLRSRTSGKHATRFCIDVGV